MQEGAATEGTRTGLASSLLPSTSWRFTSNPTSDRSPFRSHIMKSKAILILGLAVIMSGCFRSSADNRTGVDLAGKIIKLYSVAQKGFILSDKIVQSDP